MLIADEGRAPRGSHLMALALAAGIKKNDASHIIAEVQQVCAKWNEFADEAGVPKKEGTRIGKALPR